MHLLKSFLAGLCVVMMGVVTALVIAVSAVVIFVGSRWPGTRRRAEMTPAAGRVQRSFANRHDVIDVDASEVTDAGR
jgi:hypothetical protein